MSYCAEQRMEVEREILTVVNLLCGMDPDRPGTYRILTEEQQSIYQAALMRLQYDRWALMPQNARNQDLELLAGNLIPAGGPDLYAGELVDAA